MGERRVDATSPFLHPPPRLVLRLHLFSALGEIRTLSIGCIFPVSQHIHEILLIEIQIPKISEQIDEQELNEKGSIKFASIDSMMMMISRL